MIVIREIVDRSIIALRPIGLPVDETLPIKVGEYGSIEFRLYFFWVPNSTFCLILCLCQTIFMEKHI